MTLQDFDPSDDFATFFYSAVDRAIESAEIGALPLIPSILVETEDGQQQMRRYLVGDKDERGEHIEDSFDLMKSYEAAIESVGPGKGFQKYAVWWDGFITMEDRRWDAIFVEAGESTDELGALFAQRYTIEEDNKGVMVGNVTLVDRPPSRIFAG